MNPPSPEPGFRRSWPWELSAAAVALVGVAVRMIPWRYVFSGGTMVPPGTLGENSEECRVRTTAQRHVGIIEQPAAEVNATGAQLHSAP